MAGSSSNDDILQQLRLGIIDFEISSSPVPSVSTHFPRSPRSFGPFTDAKPRFFARIGNLAGSDSPALKKVGRYSVWRVAGDGRFLFRALVKGMALNNGAPLSSQEERENADDLRMAVREIICDNGNERHQYEEALIAITVEEPLRRYCQRIRRPDFWGGEAELLVLSKLCCHHMVVYIPEHEVLYDNLKLILDFKHACKVGILSCWPPSSSFKLTTRGKEGQGQSPPGN